MVILVGKTADNEVDIRIVKSSQVAKVLHSKKVTVVSSEKTSAAKAGAVIGKAPLPPSSTSTSTSTSTSSSSISTSIPPPTPPPTPVLSGQPTPSFSCPPLNLPKFGMSDDAHRSTRSQREESDHRLNQSNSLPNSVLKNKYLPKVSSPLCTQITPEKKLTDVQIDSIGPSRPLKPSEKQVFLDPDGNDVGREVYKADRLFDTFCGPTNLVTSDGRPVVVTILADYGNHQKVRIDGPEDESNNEDVDDLKLDPERVREGVLNYLKDQEVLEGEYKILRDRPIFKISKKVKKGLSTKKELRLLLILAELPRHKGGDLHCGFVVRTGEISERDLEKTVKKTVAAKFPHTEHITVLEIKTYFKDETRKLLSKEGERFRNLLKRVFFMHYSHPYANGNTVYKAPMLMVALCIRMYIQTGFYSSLEFIIDSLRNVYYFDSYPLFTHEIIHYGTQIISQRHRISVIA